MKKYIIFIASAVLMMTACAKEEINTATGENEGNGAKNSW